jgi:hypothetical protein
MHFDSTTTIAENARQLVDRHGDAAPDIAAGRASRMERLGDVQRRTDWLCVMISAQQMLVSRQGW